MSGWIGYLVAGLLGGLVGAAELAARYRDRITLSLSRLASVFYMLVNVGASVGAVAMIRTFDWTFGQEGAARALLQVLIGGLGAVALFRTRLLAGAERGVKVNWNPSGLLDRLLTICDSQVDRAQAAYRSKVVNRLMSGLSFERSYAALPSFALALLENPSEDEQRKLAADVKALVDDANLNERTKILLLGIAVVRVTGPELLTRAVEGLGDVIKADQKPLF